MLPGTQAKRAIKLRKGDYLTKYNEPVLDFQMFGKEIQVHLSNQRKVSFRIDEQVIVNIIGG